MNIEPKKICYCTNLTNEKILSIIEEKNLSFENFIKKTGASTYCGACYTEIKNLFYFYRYQKKICKQRNYLLFSKI